MMLLWTVRLALSQAWSRHMEEKSVSENGFRACTGCGSLTPASAAVCAICGRDLGTAGPTDTASELNPLAAPDPFGRTTAADPQKSAQGRVRRPGSTGTGTGTDGGTVVIERGVIDASNEIDEPFLVREVLTATLTIEGGDPLTIGLATGERFLIGRDPARCDLSLDDPRVSRVHAALTVVDGVWHIEDLESANGTFVGEDRIGTNPVALGKPIRLGRTRLHLVPVAPA